MKIFSETSNKDFALLICKHLDISLGDANVSKFSNSEISLVINENVRKEDVFVIQSTGPSITNSPNDNILELEIF